MSPRHTIVALGIAVAVLLTASPAGAVVWTWWLGAGAGARGVASDSVQPVFAPRVGLSLMPTLHDRISRFHMLLGGPWLGVESKLDGVLGEGGLEFTFAPIHADDMMYGLRLGGGAGRDSNGRATLLSATLLMGFRNVSNSCDALNLAHGVRVYATIRDTLATRSFTVVAGFEIEPSLLFPPYSRRAIVGWGRNGECEVGL